MERPLLGDQTPAEYFKDLVAASLARQHVRAADLTEYYLVNLLCQYIRLDAGAAVGEVDEPLALRLARAMRSGGLEQRARLRSLGDFSLFMTGFFPDSFRRRLVDVDYYVSMGEYAYGSLARLDEDAFSEVFTELANKFVGFTDVLADISERTCARLAYRRAQTVREMAEDRQRARRPATGRAGHPPEQFDRQAIPPVGAFGSAQTVRMDTQRGRTATACGKTPQYVSRRRQCSKSEPKRGGLASKGTSSAPDAAGTETSKGL